MSQMMASLSQDDGGQDVEDESQSLFVAMDDDDQCSPVLAKQGSWLPPSTTYHSEWHADQCVLGWMVRLAEQGCSRASRAPRRWEPPRWPQPGLTSSMGLEKVRWTQISVW